jgi:hypothetical protein
MNKREISNSSLADLKAAHERTNEIFLEIFSAYSQRAGVSDEPSITDLRRYKQALVLEKTFAMQAEMNLVDSKLDHLEIVALVDHRYLN